MKKAFQFFAILLFASLSLTSCSSDDNATSVVLLKKLNASVLGDDERFEFSYEGTKLIEISYQISIGNTTTGYSKFVYTGDLITQMKDYNSSNVNTYNSFFTYNEQGQLTQVMKVQVGVDNAERTVFIYKTDNTVGSEHYIGTVDSQTYLTDTEKFYFENNKLIQKDYSYGVGGFQTTYLYDTANHPMKNVTGIDGIKLYVNSFDASLSIAQGLRGASNNIIKQTTDAGTANETVVDFEVQYNNTNFPVSSYSTPDSPGPYSYNYEYYN